MASLRLLLILFVFACTTKSVDAKITSGDFKLSGKQTEYILGSFANVPFGAYNQLYLRTDTMYENTDSLYFRAYRDVEWSKVQKLTTCSEKIQYAYHSNPIEFKKQNDGTYTAKTHIEIFRHDPKTRELWERSHYWYFVLDDCSLEQYYHDNNVPKIHYTIHMQNFKIWDASYVRYGEFSADERALYGVHAFSMLTTVIVFLYLILHVIYKLNFDFSKQYTVHAAVLWVGLASIFDITSGLCELIHMSIYNLDGIGSYTLDALSAHFEAICDATIMVLLLSIAAGWTLPSSMITVPSSRSDEILKSPILQPIRKLITALKNPVSTGMKGPWGKLALSIGSLHLILSQWGRIYNDDFDSYHDMDHLPGQILLFIRTVGGIVFVNMIRITISSKKCPPSLTRFYYIYGFFGFIWFWALPIWVLYCHVAIPYYQLKPYVFGGCCVLQCLSQVLLGWLVTFNATPYHQYSRISAKNQQETLTDTSSLDISNNATSSASQPSYPSVWCIGRKAKVRFD